MAHQLSPELLLQAYDLHIAEARSDLEQLRSLRETVLQNHTAKMKEQELYLAHVTRKVTSRLERGGDISKYCHYMEACYKQTATDDDDDDDEHDKKKGEQQQKTRPVNDVLRRQAMLLRATHQCEVLKKAVQVCARQHKLTATSLMNSLADLETEKEDMMAVLQQRRKERQAEVDDLKDKLYSMMKDSMQQREEQDEQEQDERNHMMDLQSQMMERRRRQSKSIQQTLKEKSNQFKQLRRDSFNKAKQRRESLGSHKSGGGGSDWGEEDNKSVGSNKSGWSARSGKSARSTRTAATSKSVGAAAKGIMDMFFGNNYQGGSSTFESEKVPIQINLTKPPQQAPFWNQMFDKGEMGGSEETGEKTADDDWNSVGGESVDSFHKNVIQMPSEIMVDISLE